MSLIRRGALSDYFEGVAVKRLSAVETSPEISNQHEFNGSDALRRLFGDADRKNIATRFVWLMARHRVIGAPGSALRTALDALRVISS